MKLSILFLITFLSMSTQAASLQDKINARKKEGKKWRESLKGKKIVSIMKKATQNLKDSGIESKAKVLNTKVPDFKIGGRNISSFYKNGPVILKFYRGHWCPYCMMELKEYQQRINKIKAKGAQLIALVPDTQKYIKKTKKKFLLSFPIYQDKENKIAKKFGLVFKLGPDLLKVYKGFKINLDESQGNTNKELPMPGTYVINTKGKIIYAFLSADYTKRADPDEVINSIKK